MKVLSGEEAQKAWDERDDENEVSSITDFLKKDESEEEDSEEEESQEEVEEEEDSEEPQDEEDSDDEELEDVDVEDEDEIEEEELEEDNFQEFNISEVTGGAFSDEEDLREFAALMNEDEYFKGLVDYYRSQKTALPYLNAHRFDFDQMDDQSILRIQFNQEYADVISDMEPEDIEEFFKDEVLAKYKQDDPESYDDREKRIGQAKMKKAASDLRSKLKDEQSKFKAPVREEQKPDPEQELQRQQKVLRQAKNLVTKSAPEGKLKFKSGETEFTVDIDSKSTVSMISNADKVLGSVFKDGEIDLRTLAFLSNPDEFIAAIQNQSSSSSVEDFIDSELGNKKKKANGKKSAAAPSDADRNNPYSSWNLRGAKIISS